MNKVLFSVMLVFISSLISFAQPSVGDVYNIDGMDVIIIHIDETNNSGIVIKAQPMTTRNIIRNNVGDKKQANKLEKGIFKARKKMGVFSEFSDEAESNMILVEEYCKTNNISFEEYFPEYAYAKSLGEGWYIPGKIEAEYYSYVRGSGPGPANYKSYNYVKRVGFKDYTTKGIAAPTQMILACYEKNKPIFLINMYRQIDMKSWLEICPMPVKGGVQYQCCPVCPVKRVQF